MTTPVPDFIPDIAAGWSDDEYRHADAINFSTLKYMADSPAHYHHAVTSTDDGDTYSRRALRAAHCLALEPEVFDRDFAVYTGKSSRATKAYKAWAAEQEERNPRITLLKQSEVQQSRDWAASVRAHFVLGAMLDAPGWSELSILWLDKRTGLACKGRVDRLVDNADGRWGPERWVILDLKQLDSTHPRRVSSHVARRYWHVQAAHYCDGIATLSGESVGYVIGVGESRAPHDAAAFSLDPDEALYAGEELRNEWLDAVKHGRETGEWPGRLQQMVPLHLPRWAWSDDSDDDATTTILD